MILLSPILITLLLFAISLFSEFSSIHTKSILALVIYCLIIFLIPEKRNEAFCRMDKFIISKYEIISEKYSFKTLFSFIIILNALINIFGFLILQSHFDFSKITSSENIFKIKSIVSVVSILTIIMAQIGGYFLQSILIYSLFILFDVNIEFRKFLTQLTLAYSGFMIIGIISVFINLFIFYDVSIDQNNYKNILQNNIIFQLTGKFGEYLTLTILSYLIYNVTKCSFKKVVFITYFPSIIILFVYLLFKF